jgi:excisionase family DNA binding protein
MSSNMLVPKVCQYCKKEFLARKTTSQTCSDHCAKMYYKQKKRGAKIDATIVDTKKILNKPIELLMVKPYLSINEASLVYGISKRTIYRLIERGELTPGKAGKRTILKQSELDLSFFHIDNYESKTQQLIQKQIAMFSKIFECYTLKEVKSKFNIEESELLKLIRKNNIPMVNSGTEEYYPKAYIDKFLT